MTVATAKSKIGAKSLLDNVLLRDALTGTSQLGGAEGPRPTDLDNTFVMFLFDIAPLASVSYMWNKSSSL
jgi:hypothetical protein